MTLLEIWSSVWPNALALVIALAGAWIVFRLQEREQRDAVLTSLVAELELHELRVGHGGYTSWNEDWWGQARTRGLAQDRLQALDDRGRQRHSSRTSLFITQDLVRALVHYRQRPSSLNQLIDDMAAFRAAPDLWLPTQHQATLRQQLKILAEMIHMGGIGDEVQYPAGANHAYHVVRRAVRAERCVSGWRWQAWFWLGLSRRANDQPDTSW